MVVQMFRMEQDPTMTQKEVKTRAHPQVYFFLLPE